MRLINNNKFFYAIQYIRLNCGVPVLYADCRIDYYIIHTKILIFKMSITYHRLKLPATGKDYRCISSFVLGPVLNRFRFVDPILFLFFRVKKRWPTNNNNNEHLRYLPSTPKHILFLRVTIITSGTCQPLEKLILSLCHYASDVRTSNWVVITNCANRLTIGSIYPCCSPCCLGVGCSCTFTNIKLFVDYLIFIMNCHTRR